MTALLAGLVAFYAAAHGGMTAIAARQGVEVPPGHVCIAHWDQERLGDTGTLYIGEVPYAIAEEVPGFVGAGLWPGILVFGGEAWPHQPL